VAGLGGGAALVSGSVVVTVLVDVNNPDIRRAYVTGEGGLGPNFGLAAEAGIVGYQGNYDEYAGLFFGVQGSTGVAGSAVVKSNLKF